MPTTTAPPTLGDTADHTDDVAAIEALIDDVAAGLAAQDPDVCVASFAADVHSVTGQRIVGRDAVRAAHVAAFASGGIPATPRFALLDITFIRPDVAIATTGAYREEPVDLDAPPTIVTWTLVRQDDGWWVAARQFTPLAP